MSVPHASAPRALPTRDPEAFRQLYELHHRHVYALAWRMCGGEAERAADLTQDVFFRLWSALPSFRGESAFTTWLHRLAVNVIWTALAKDQSAATWIADSGDDVAASPSPFDEIAAHVDLERALATLPAGARTTLVLYAIEGLDYREISAALQVDIGTVKSQLHRARRLLHQRLRHDA